MGGWSAAGLGRAIAGSPGARRAFVFAVGIGIGAVVSVLLVPVVQDTSTSSVSVGERRGPASAEIADRSSAEGPTADSGGDASQDASDGGVVGAPVATGPAGPVDDGAPTGGGGGAGGGGGTGGGGGGDDDGEPEDNGIRGVTADSVKIGVAVPSTGALGDVSDTFNIGDPQEQMEAVLDGWQREGLVPVQGRDVQFVYREYDIFSGDEQTAVCNAFVKDDEVFAVVGIRFFSSGSECVAGEHDTPLVTIDGVSSEVYERTWPYYVSVRFSLTTMFRNWVHWAHERGILEGKKLGVYHETEMAAQVEDVIEPELDKLGYDAPVKVDAGSGEGFGGSSRDSVAVQQFQTEGVEVLMPLIGSTQFASFMQQAESQGYRPTYIDSDFADHSSDAATSIFPAEQYDGTEAMSGKRVGEAAAGILHPRAEACLSNYERYSDREISREPPESAEYDTILTVCDDGHTVLRGLQEAGRDLTPLSFVGGLEAVRDEVMAGHGPVSFSGSAHHGVTRQRTVRWDADCACWNATGSFAPLWVG